jgi:hypothetical protein
MKKQFFLPILGLIAASLLLFNSCIKDATTQEEVLQNQQVIDMVIRILDASNDDLPLDGANVSIVDGSKVDSASTDANGLAFFENVVIGGDIPVTV